MKRAWRIALAAGLLAASVAPGRADLQIIGEGITGSVAVSNGTSLWSLIANVQTPVDAGYNDHNAILHNYVVAKSASGAISVFSAGELNPSFGATNLAPYISVAGSDYRLVDPNAGASARGLDDLTSLSVIAVSARPNGAGGQSSSFTLSGLVANPGIYTASDLTFPPPASVTVGGSAYLGQSLYSFLDPTASDPLSAIVVTSASDGYLVVFSLAELDPALGGDPNALLAYAGATFPGAGLARIVTPDDNRHGRWVSNLVSLEVVAVPEAPTWLLLAAGFAGLAAAARRTGRSARTA